MVSGDALWRAAPRLRARLNPAALRQRADSRAFRPDRAGRHPGEESAAEHGNCSQESRAQIAEGKRRKMKKQRVRL